MLIGYARVSTDEQNLDLQLQALRSAGCVRIHEDRGLSGVARHRPGLQKALRSARAGDVIVVWRLDRLGRSLAHLIEMVSEMRRRNIGFMSLQEQIDTTSAAGRFYLHMLGALAEFERELIRDRTRAGMAAARQRGVTLGRPRKLTAAQVNEARARLARGEKSDAVAATYDVSANTLRRAISHD